MAFLGIDLGTSSVKALMLDEQGQTLGTSKRDYEVRSPHSGWAESDPEDWWRATVEAVHEVREKVPQVSIKALGLAGQMHGVVPTDEQGRAVRAAMLWADTRAEAELYHYFQLSGDSSRRLANPLLPGMAGPLLCWLARHENEHYQAMRWALQPKDWLRWQLTGRAAADPSDASGTLLYDLVHNCWDEEVIAELGLRRELFPSIIPAAAQAGVLTQRAADELGLPAGLPIATGAADTAAAALGTGLLTPGVIQLTLGTGAQIIQLQNHFQPDESLRTHLYRAADGANWYSMAAIQNAGLVLDWVRQTLNASWEEMYASADSVIAGSEGLVFLPDLTRERPHQPANHHGGAFLHLRLHHQRPHLLHAALEGVASGIRQALEALPGVQEGGSLRLAGGGSVHPAWRQMLADILNRELQLVDTSSASARGAALLAGIVAGHWPDAAATATVAPGIETSVCPQPEQVKAYEESYQQFLKHALTNL
ncbi:xylulokinase [Dictyobacter aurantiacus]|uniref:Xylulose kinase n=1 Tax=Dictyobacter aurantiacus TaxID=1936993 RepID=A0A401ZJ48_9CHLR|nr:xylulokinase [Dictyobacter aurantiacus]GCE06877.1 sugar kinase [Dictyobacter aurantiacus]